MKCHALTLAIVLMLTVLGPRSSVAQTSFLVGMGNSTASVSGDENVALESRSDLVTGGAIAFPLGGAASVRFELDYSSRGFEVRNPHVDSTEEIRLEYFEASSLLKIPLGNRYGPHLYALTGPSLAFLLSASTKDPRGEDLDISDLFESTDVLFNVGGGFAIPTGSSSFILETRYNIGLSNLLKDTETVELKNRGVQVVMGITLGI